MVKLLVAATLLPILVLGATSLVSLVSLNRNAGDLVEETTASQQQVVANEVLRGVGTDLSRTIDLFMLQQWEQVRVWAQIPTLVEAAEEATELAEAEGLNQLSMEELEERFLLTGEFGDGVDARYVLNGLVADNPYIVDAFFTDANGYNVAYANKPSDFVQNDETWWQAVQPVAGNSANNRFRVAVEEAEFDESANRFTVTISVPLFDRLSDQVFGAMKSEVDLLAIQNLADSFASVDQGLDVTIVSPDGIVLAETASDHDLDRIMSASVDVPEDGASIIDETGVRTFVTMNDVRTNEGFSPLGDALNWTIVVDQDAENAFAAVAPLRQLEDDLGSAAVSTTVIIIVMAIVVLIGAIIAALVFARRLTAPILQLQERVEAVANTELPRYLELVQAADVDDELPHMEPIDIRTGDELESLADSFNQMQDTAATLAAEQAQMRRRNVSTTFVSLGRRNQNLLGRQLKFIDELERKETDTALLESLFKLDHLATRMRRNAESLLVLAGEDPPRRWNHPVSVQNVVRASAAEIEDYRRVRVRGIEDASVQGDVATEVTHLLAELIENASSFSPPGTEIEVFGRARANHYRISVVDHGVGMSADELTTANERVRNPVAFDQAPSAFLGLFVVGHLAARHGVLVELQPTAPEGTTVVVDIPLHLIAGAEVAVAPSAPVNRAEDVEVIRQRAADERASRSTADDQPVIIPDDQPVAVPDRDDVPAPAAPAPAGSTPGTRPGDTADPGAVDTGDTAPVEVVGAEAVPITSAGLQTELAGDADAELAALAEVPTSEAVPAEDEDLATTRSGFKVRKPGSHTTVRPRKGGKPAGGPASEEQRTAETVRDSLSRLRSGVERAENESKDG